MKAAVVEEIARTRCLDMLPSAGEVIVQTQNGSTVYSSISSVFLLPTRRPFEQEKPCQTVVCCSRALPSASEHDSRPKLLEQCLEVPHDLRHVYGDMDVDWQR